jgi:hypothetical protein
VWCRPEFAGARSLIRGRRMLPTARATPEARLGEENDASRASYLLVKKTAKYREKLGKSVCEIIFIVDRVSL